MEREDNISWKKGKKEEMARQSTSDKYLLNEEYCLLCYSERTRRLSRPNSTPATMGFLTREMHFSQVNRV